LTLISGRWNFGDSLDFEGVHDNTALRNDESKEASRGDTKNALERIQVDFVLKTPLEDDSQIIKMLGAFLGSSSEIVQVCEDDMS
jgi:hypothetical protein